jgi:hypothetical protein
MKKNEEIQNRPVAQLAERRSPKPKVGGSIPPWPVGVFEFIFETSKV